MYCVIGGTATTPPGSCKAGAVGFDELIKNYAETQRQTLWTRWTL